MVSPCWGLPRAATLGLLGSDTCQRAGLVSGPGRPAWLRTVALGKADPVPLLPETGWPGSREFAFGPWTQSFGIYRMQGSCVFSLHVFSWKSVHRIHGCAEKI